MNDIDKSTLLIQNLIELEENTVLELTRERLNAGDEPFKIIEDAQRAMHLVGERYAEGNYYISSMMMAGEIFREVMEIVEPVLVTTSTGDESGHILLGTVEGDIHDIGKNIYEILLRSHGFTVTDLGVDTPPDQFVQEAMRVRPDIIALTGLLTISYDSMMDTVQRIRQLDDLVVAKIPIIIGGGTVNAMVCSFVGADYWASDAMVGVNLCKQIMRENTQI
jgi:methanogenic corrinoid protein MtbC1